MARQSVLLSGSNEVSPAVSILRAFAASASRWRMQSRISVLQQLQRESAALLRKFPGAGQALSEALSAERRAAQASRVKRHSRFLRSETSPAATQPRPALSSRLLADRSTGTLQSKQGKITAKRGRSGQRPSPGSHVARNGRARNYSGQSAKRKPPSGSSASSRKRSSAS